MPYKVREQMQDHESYQDSAPAEQEIDGPGELLTATTPGTNRSLGWLSGGVKALLVMMGEFGIRRSNTSPTGTDRQLTGTILSNGPNLIGSGTLLLTELKIGESVRSTNSEWRTVKSIESNSLATLITSFTSDVPGGSPIFRRRTVAERMDTMVESSTIASGIQGGLEPGSTLNPPRVSTGFYGVRERVLKFTDSEEITYLSHCYGNDVPEPGNWYYTLISDQAAPRRQLATGADLLTGLTIDSIADRSGGIARITFRNAPDLSGVQINDIYRTDDTRGIGISTANQGLFLITGTDNTTKWIEIKNNRLEAIPAEASSLGVGAVYEPIPETLTPRPQFSDLHQGYYDGEYRILGIDYVNSTGLSEHIISYKSGRDKSDSEFRVDNSSVYGISSTNIVAAGSLIRAWGSDYSFASSPDQGMTLTINITGLYMVMMTITGGVSAYAACLRNSSTYNISTSEPVILEAADDSTANSRTTASATLHLNARDVLRFVKFGKNVTFITIQLRRVS